MKLILPFLFLFFSNLANAQQVDSYDLSVEDITYASLSSPTELFVNWNWDSENISKKIDFDAQLFGEDFSSLWVSALGGISTDMKDESDNPVGHVLFGAFWECDIVSTITYQIENEILKVEWKNSQYSYQEDTAYINFQIWLHKDGKVEYLYGDLFINPLEYYDELVVGISQNFSSDEDNFQAFWSLQGDVATSYLEAFCYLDDLEDQKIFRPQTNKKYILSPIEDAYALPFRQSTFQEDYNALENANILLSEESDSTLELVLPFNFPLFGKQLDKIFINSTGIITSKQDENSFISEHVIFPFFFANGFSSTNILYKTEESTDDRIFKIEWKDAVVGQIPSKWTNFQIWFYENDHSLEFRYGPSNFDSSTFEEFPLYIGFMQNVNNFSGNIENIWISYGDAEKPTFSRTCNIYYLDSKTSYYPFERLVYRFDPSTFVASEDIFTTNDISINPTITDGLITIHALAKIQQIQIFNITGLLIKNQTSNIENNIQIDLSNKPNGSYFIRVTTKNGVSTQKIIKL